MKFSKYNIIVPAEQGNIIVYNTLSGAVIKIASERYQENNIILISKGMVVEDNVEELMIYKYKYEGLLYQTSDLDITIATTMNCNLRCPYCFEGDSKCSEYMTKDVANAIIKYIIAKKQKKINICWFGGEPLMNYEIIDYISKQLIHNHIKFNATIVSNGTILNKKIIQTINSCKIRNMQISLDGKRETHNTKRFFANKQGTYDLIIENVTTLLDETQIQVFLKVNIDRNNMSEFRELYKDLNERFENYILSGRLKIMTNYIRNKTNFSGCESCIEETEYNKFRKKYFKERTLPQLATPCPIRCLSSLIFGPDGNIYKCLDLLGKIEKSIGNIKEFNISISKQSNHALRFSPFENDECRECPVLPICGGGCPLEREQSILANEKMQCPDVKYNIKQKVMEVYASLSSKNKEYIFNQS